MPAGAAPLQVDVLALVQPYRAGTALGSEEIQGVVGGVSLLLTAIPQRTAASCAALGRMHLLGIDRQGLRAAAFWRAVALPGLAPP
ncbi:MAG: hypothetical protein WBG92_08955 [Thiohalocapsa sp.]